MSEYFTNDTVTVHHGDCLDVLRELPDASVDAVVTDPPYGLSFMGKEWDRPRPRSGVTGVACVECGNDDPTEGFTVCSDCLEALGHDGDTYRRETRGDHGGRSMLGHVSKNWHEKGTHSRGYADNDNAAFGAWCEEWSRECLRVLKPGGHLLAFGGTRTWHRLAVAVEDAGFEVRDSLAWLYGSGFPKSLDVSKAIDKAAGHWRGRAGEVVSENDSMGAPNYERTPKGDPVTEAAAAAAGWGTALKPAFEPVVVGRKPLSGTVAANFTLHGTGALNIAGCRLGSTERTFGGPESAREGSQSIGAFTGEREVVTVAGRWPANVILDESQAAELDAQSGASRSRIGKPRGAGSGDGWGMTATGAEYDDQGGASRFFYVAKADQSERPRADGIAHPTVKPLELMQWLVRLVTPPGGTVLEPFAGSGTTVEACITEGFRCIAIEREADYLPLIRRRILRRTDYLTLATEDGEDIGLLGMAYGREEMISDA